MYNPRWPHTLSVYVESLDSNGLPVTDENGDPIATAKTLLRVEYDSRWNPVRGADGAFKTTEVTELPWGYRTSTGGIKDSGDVFKADYKISTPMMLTHLPEGTVVTMTDYDSTFRAVVKKQTTYNWGTNIWLDAAGNEGAIYPVEPPTPPTPPTPDDPVDPAEGGEDGEQSQDNEQAGE